MTFRLLATCQRLTYAGSVEWNTNGCTLSFTAVQGELAVLLSTHVSWGFASERFRSLSGV